MVVMSNQLPVLQQQTQQILANDKSNIQLQQIKAAQQQQHNHVILQQVSLI